ncbi:hypothetical protein CDAR_197061 [Caerostris darwini]|uniref:Uncharacterized protein n=1 Tax=Caerostris darwini TaxID=1538125 RepID=A0AAV4UJF2_9ARAC|nr:hypothetical protein CDAR_197061 [Caerostris darwini]
MDLDCECMLQALAFYDNIVEHSGSKDIKKKIKKSIRINALAIVKIVASQNTYIAHLEGRIQELEKAPSVKITSQREEFAQLEGRLIELEKAQKFKI